MAKCHKKGEDNEDDYYQIPLRYPDACNACTYVWYYGKCGRPRKPL
jgi:hypothetical protein